MGTEGQDYVIDGEEVFSLVKQEDEYVAGRQDFSIRRPGLHPSSASVCYVDGNRKVTLGKCLRAAYYSAAKVPREGGVNVSLNMKASLGKWDEIGNVDKWKEMGIWVANNIKFYNKELALSGEMDGIIRHPNTGELIGVEMKTFYGYPANRSICGVTREKGTGNRYNGRPKDEHFLQSILYRWEYRETLSDYRLYYMERGDGHRIEFRVGWDERPDGTHQVWWQQIPGPYWKAFSAEKVFQPYTIEDIHARYRDLLVALREKKVPAKDYTDAWDAEEVEYRWENAMISKTNYDKWNRNPVTNKLGDWHCSYCDYNQQCEEDEA